MHNSKSETQCKLLTLGDNDVFKMDLLNITNVSLLRQNTDGEAEFRGRLSLGGGRQYIGILCTIC